MKFHGTIALVGREVLPPVASQRNAASIDTDFSFRVALCSRPVSRELGKLSKYNWRKVRLRIGLKWDHDGGQYNKNFA